MRTRKKETTLRGIKRLREGVYKIRVTWIDPRTGRKEDERRTVECATLEQAARARAALAAEARAREGEPAPCVQVRVYARSWLLARLPKLKASTQARYARDLDKVVEGLGDLYVDQLRQSDITAWLSQRIQVEAAGTVNGYVRVLRTMLADAQVEFGLSHSPMERVSIYPDKRRKAVERKGPENMLSAEEMGGFLGELRARFPQWYALAFTQFALARRFGEVSALRWEDIDEEGGVVTIRRAQWNGIVDTIKTDDPYSPVRQVIEVPLTEELRTVLRTWRQHLIKSQHRHVGSGWVFPSSVGTPHKNASVMRKAFARCLGGIGVDRRFTSHGLRRTANNLLRKIASGLVTRAIVGHSSEEMTEHYSHVDHEEKRAAAEGLLQLVQGGSESGTSSGTGRAKVAQRRNARSSRSPRAESFSAVTGRGGGI